MGVAEQPSREGVAVRKATAADADAMVRSLGRAFQTDPIMSWIFPDERRRPDILRAFFDVSVRRLYLRYGETYIHDAGEGAALWGPPGKWKVSTLDILRNGPRLARVMGRRLAPGLRAMLLAERKHPHQPEHYYLAVLGVDPDHQGHGVGSALLRQMLTRADTEGVPAYLEASSENNRRLYERHGFKVQETVPLPGGGPPFHRMWRDVGGSS